MDADAQRTAQQIHQRYEDTSLVIFRQAQKKLIREFAYTGIIGNSDVSVPEAGAAMDVGAVSGHRLANLFRRGSRSKAAQSAICVLF